MEFETIRSVAVDRVALCEMGWQIDNVNGTKGTRLDTDATPGAQSFANARNGVGAFDLNTTFANAIHRTTATTFLLAFLWLAFFCINHGETVLSIRHGVAVTPQSLSKLRTSHYSVVCCFA